MKLREAKRRAKAIFAERIHKGDTPKAAGDFTKKQMELEAGADWAMLLKLIMPIILQLIAAFGK